MEMVFDKTKMCKEVIYTDIKTGAIKALVPVNVDGTEDKERKTLFSLIAHLMTPQGPVPINASSSAETLEQAAETFSETINTEIGEMVKRAEQMQKDEANKIIMPGAETSDVPLRVI